MTNHAIDHNMSITIYVIFPAIYFLGFDWLTKECVRETQKHSQETTPDKYDRAKIIMFIILWSDLSGLS